MLFSKRIAPQEVKSIFIGGLEFRVEHFSTDKNNKPTNGGIIEVWNTETKIKERIITVYRNKYNIFLETDAQDVFITNMELNKDKNIIVITNEKREKYELYIKTYKIRKLR